MQTMLSWEVSGPQFQVFTSEFLLMAQFDSAAGSRESSKAIKRSIGGCGILSLEKTTNCPLSPSLSPSHLQQLNIHCGHLRPRLLQSQWEGEGRRRRRRGCYTTTQGPQMTLQSLPQPNSTNLHGLAIET